MKFTHRTMAQKVILETGAAARHLSEELDELGSVRPMVISDRPRELTDELISGLDVGLVWDQVVMHVPTDLAHKARTAAQDADVDALVCIGGGSATGLAKAIAITNGLPIVAIPTTYAGSEATAVWGMTEDRTKTTGVDDKALPKVVIYDSTYTRTMPVPMSVASGFNAMAHCIDSMWAPATDPIAQALALEGVRALSSGLPMIVDTPDGIEGRDRCLYGAYLSAVSFASAGSGLHHKICHVLGGTFNLPHAQVHATVLPYVLAYNAPSATQVSSRLAEALGCPVADGQDAALTVTNAFEALRDRVNAPRDLQSIGFQPDMIDEATTRIVAAAPASNPRPVTEENITELLNNALTGTDPRSIL